MSALSTAGDTELEALHERLTAFARAHVGPGVEVASLRWADGHAGFAYLFELVTGDVAAGYFLRLPPPGVRREGTADVLRQVLALRALDGTSVPRAAVVWSGDDPRWFEAPYFVTDLVPGTTLGTREDVERLGTAAVRSVGRQAMDALAQIHRVPWTERCDALGPAAPLEDHVTRWDRFAERAAEPELLALQPDVRDRLLDTLPEPGPLSLCHGDFQFGNLMATDDGALRAVIDWELCSIAPPLTDVGWITAFHDSEAWGPALRPAAAHVSAAMLQTDYEVAAGRPCEGLPWFQALALYKYAVISGFNLMLHRRGKRHDPAWEWRSRGAPHNLRRALQLLEQA